MNSQEMFDAIDRATGCNLAAYALRKEAVPVCNLNDVLLSTFCGCMDADELIERLSQIEKAAWAARKAAELRRDHETDNPTEVTAFSFNR